MSHSWEIEFLKHYVAGASVWNRALIHFRSSIEVGLSGEFIDVVKIEGRVKAFESCIEKIIRKRYLAGIEPERHLDVIRSKITDVIGLRIVCYFEHDVAKIVQVLRKKFYVLWETNKIEDLEESESAFGYRAHHLGLQLLKTGDDDAAHRLFGTIGFEVQVRTVVQDAWACLEHKLAYKKTISKLSRRKLFALAAAFESIDYNFTELRAQIATDAKAIAEIPAHLSPLNTKDEIALHNQIVTIIDAEIPVVHWQRLMLDLDALYPQWSTNEIVSALKDGAAKYREFLGQNLQYNARQATKVRILLYASNPIVFKAIVSLSDRQIFDSWRVKSEHRDSLKKKTPKD
jgi:ppGpp synthetase/RelA/SpoT-type nucleotidyltranferase